MEITKISYAVSGDTNSVVIETADGAKQYTSVDHESVVQWLADGHTIDPAPAPPPYGIPSDLPWSRMTEEEAELVQEQIDSSPVKTRNLINKATSFTEGTDAFIKFKDIITATLDIIRAGYIMAPMTQEELSALTPEES